ncbi:prepilin-type N-terminal cleavage/methylation domain-containing protein [Virgibacillus halodenitrificans]|uniref:Prepilin-type N-terminal cleavage/methylation domain-containing protein n=1 Tax=Virgibacillus halodenitrificans TaxID=1482 RepID=A0ABR7VPT6_VIRHA|nr:prepilin-type N-terminal cleavage/methylation domain-containing protein [Virgibacillus halodenitrificans]MBD1223929.1 prepilin-type N-terminal cleavage/methylation domain-containing protein [Virgibacillus halodenitrificans]MYL60832.1 prepilin-type N-terminal cleavage/methylation domain-containing protein [Virgibacillus halodenitrificans]WHX27746.1 prepilin-type N-terminal cleavage/methylation domain-containing protein [Virgibacillus halodenitrificans]
MLTRMKKMLKKQKGFTLVELLAVIAILAIIVAIAVPTVGKVIDNSKSDAHDANIELIENAARLADVSGSFTEGMSPTDLKDTGFLEEVPVNPNTDSEYGGSVSKNENGQFKYTP